MYELLRSLILFVTGVPLDVQTGPASWWALLRVTYASTQRWVECYAVKRHHLTGKPGSAFPLHSLVTHSLPLEYVVIPYGGEGWNGGAVVVESSAVNYREEKPCSSADRPPGIPGRLVGETPLSAQPRLFRYIGEKTSGAVSVLPPRTACSCLPSSWTRTRCFSSNAGPTKSHDILVWLSR